MQFWGGPAVICSCLRLKTCFTDSHHALYIVYDTASILCTISFYWVSFSKDNREKNALSEICIHKINLLYYHTYRTLLSTSNGYKSSTRAFARLIFHTFLVQATSSWAKSWNIILKRKNGINLVLFSIDKIIVGYEEK